jgi:3-oxoacyl-[acyl-carrier-protein] synthase III
MRFRRFIKYKQAKPPMTNAAIASFAKYLPEEVLDNAFFLEKTYRDPATGELNFRTNEKFILENMVPEMRRHSRPDEYTSDMASEVARQLPCRHVYNNIRQYGNMSAATCAVAGAEAQELGMLNPGTKLIMSSYGSGTIAYTVAVQF